MGLALLLASRASFRRIQAEEAARDILIAGLALVGRLLFATLVLFVYSRLASEGIAAFGLSLAGSFLVGYTVELVRYAGLHRYTRPAAGSRDGR